MAEEGFVRRTSGDPAGKGMALLAHASAQGFPFITLYVDPVAYARGELAVDSAACLLASQLGCHGKHLLVEALRRVANEIELIPCQS